MILRKLLISHQQSILEGILYFDLNIIELIKVLPSRSNIIIVDTMRYDTLSMAEN